MVIHAENEQQKKDTAHHIVNGTICKNCKNYNSKLHDCSKWLTVKPIDEYGYCSKFCRRDTRDS